MPTSERHLSLSDACSLVGSCGFGPLPGSGSRPPRLTIGVELESFTVPTIDPLRLPAADLPAGSRLTFEPGGQVELSSPPQTTVAAACDALSSDLAAARRAFSPLGVNLVQKGLLEGEPRRLIDAPRYQAMEAYFDTAWPDAGRTMMSRTASVQVNLGLGGVARAGRRWRAANVLGPVLAAAFSSSPTATGFGCDRLATWLRLDPSRTGPVPLDVTEPADPRSRWVDYALAANVMLIRTDDGHQPVVDAPLSARDWIEHGHPLGWPTADDISYHLTTLFPPVRPRRWLELRMVDALPDPWWRVPIAVAAVLIDDNVAVRACEPVARSWWEAAVEGLNDPGLAAAAAVCAQRARVPSAMRAVGVDVATAVLVEQWAATVRKGCEPPWQ